VDELEVAPGLWATRHFALWLKEEGAVAISDLHLGGPERRPKDFEQLSGSAACVRPGRFFLSIDQ